MKTHSKSKINTPFQVYLFYDTLTAENCYKTINSSDHSRQDLVYWIILLMVRQTYRNMPARRT